MRGWLHAVPTWPLHQNGLAHHHHHHHLLPRTAVCAVPRRFREDKQSAVLCTQNLDSEDLDDFRDAVAEDYYFQVRAMCLRFRGV